MATYVDTKARNTKKVPQWSGGMGMQVATILSDPQIEESERIMFASHTKRYVVRGFVSIN